MGILLHLYRGWLTGMYGFHGTHGAELSVSSDSDVSVIESSVSVPVHILHALTVRFPIPTFVPASLESKGTML